MIDFSKIEKRNFFYEISYPYVWFVHKYIYYRHFVIRGMENVPKQGEPFMIISNHQNSLNDAMAYVFGLRKHRPVMIARGDIFKKEIIAKLWRWMRILPAFRVRDGGRENLGNNEYIFKRSAEILRNGGSIALFPEAMHQDRRFLGNFKKGFARIAFTAEEMADFNLNLQILPVANHYTDYFSMGGELLLNIGKPFTIKQFFDTYKEHPEKAYHDLATYAYEREKEIMLDMPDKETYEQYDMLRNMYFDIYKEQQHLRKANIANRLDADRLMVEKLDAMKESDPELFAETMTKTAKYCAGVDKMNFRNWLVGTKNSAFGIAMRILWHIILIPFYILCFVLNAIPYFADLPIIKNIKDKFFYGSIHIAVGTLVIFPLWYILVFGLSFLIPWPWWCSFVLIAIMPITLVHFRMLRGSYLKLYHRLRYFRLVKRKNPEIMELIDIKTELLETLKKI